MNTDSLPTYLAYQTRNSITSNDNNLIQVQNNEPPAWHPKSNIKVKIFYESIYLKH